MRTSAVPLVFLALSGLAVSIRDTRSVDAELRDEETSPEPLNTEGDEVQATQLINKLEKAILTRNQGMSVESYLEKGFSARNTRACDQTSAPASSLYLDGWVCFLRPFGLTKPEATSLMSMLGTQDLGQKIIYIEAATVKDAILGQGTEEERDQVLAAVWLKVTGHGIEDGAPLLEENLKCKLPEKRGFFLDHLKEQAQVANEDSVTYDVFRTYYLKLGKDIISHRLFVLMVVNAWHLMVSPFDQVNTVNLRVRAVEETEKDNAGTIYALKDDCGIKPGEEQLSKLARIKQRLEVQTGKTFKFVKLSDRA